MNRDVTKGEKRELWRRSHVLFDMGSLGGHVRVGNVSFLRGRDVVPSAYGLTTSSIDYVCRHLAATYDV